MFTKLKTSTISTGALLFLALTACKYELEPFVSNLGIEASCIPTAQFYSAVDSHVKEQLQSFRSEVDQRDSQVKYQELATLFKTAQEEARNCFYYYLKSSGSNVDEDYTLDVHMKFTRMWTIVTVYESVEKEWEDSDITLIEDGLAGKEIEPNWEGLFAPDCSEELVAENAEDHMGLQLGGCQDAESGAP